MMGNACARGWVFVALLAACAGASAADVRAIRVSETPQGAQAILDLSGPVEYKVFRLGQPDRIVLDLDDSNFADGFTPPPSAGALVKGVRIGHHGDKGARVVLDLSGTAQPRSFLQPPDRKHGYRLVVELGSTAAALAAGSTKPLPPARNVVVAIDAGHGGKDPGSHGPRGTLEKNVTLSVARDLAKAIDAQPGMTAVLTRDSDTFIPLKRRYQIARQHNADLFISIHADAFRDHDARGSSVWVLSPRGKTSEAARWLADRENRADLVGGVSLDDKDDTLAAVLLDLSQGAAIQISSAVARNVLHALAKLGPTHHDYVEHANFVVLRSPDVPSILVETAFISNPREEKLLASSSHRERLAKAILGGVRDYFASAPPPGTWFAAQMHDRGEKHIVARGETLSVIAAQYGVSTDTLKKANGLADADSLRTGSVLLIPAG